MKKDTHKTDMIFRYYKSVNAHNRVLALFPHQVDSIRGHVMCYQHVGQHGLADYPHCINITRPATPQEYADLKYELEGLGYNINIVKRQNRAKFLKSYYANR